MDYAMYKKLKEDIERDYHKKLDALELLWNDYRPHSTPSRSSDKKSSQSGQSGKLSNVMRDIINGFTGEFTADDIEGGLKEIIGEGNFNRLQITNTLHRLYRRGEIEVAEKGRGRAPGRYKKKAIAKIQAV